MKYRIQFMDMDANREDYYVLADDHASYMAVLDAIRSTPRYAVLYAVNEATGEVVAL